MREAPRSYRQMVYLDDLTDAEFVLFTDDVAGQLENSYPSMEFVEMQGVDDTVDMVVVSTIVDELDADAHNMRFTSIRTGPSTAQGVLPAGLDHSQQKAFYVLRREGQRGLRHDETVLQRHSGDTTDQSVKSVKWKASAPTTFSAGW